ncbi:UDP-N-acetylmuramate--L-alanine ligase [Patescibacteria group bacterium]
MIKNIHFMGIGGSGVAGVAALASQMGFGVTGCDLEKNTAYSKNVVQGHSRDHLRGVDLVVASPAVYFQNSNHPEFLEAKKQGKLITWQEFLGDYLTKGKKVICVAGTHGKSTTTAMVAKLLIDAKFDPLALVGAGVFKWRGNSRFGKGEYFVIEADEFFDSFLNYHPEIIILNNIEFDHPDYFKSETQLFNSYKSFIENFIGEKVLIVNSDDLGVNKLLKMINLDDFKIIKYSPKKECLGLRLKVFGKHNIANALGVKALGKYLGISKQIINDSLSTFEGIERRMQLLGMTKKGVLIYDDYAHHPTAISATLQALREKYPNKRIWAIVEAHGYERTNTLLGSYKGVFSQVDKVIVGPIFKARDKKTFGVTPEKIVKASKHKNALAANSFKQIQLILNKEVKSDDIILVMGAGKSYLWSRKLLKNLQQ